MSRPAWSRLTPVAKAAVAACALALLVAAITIPSLVAALLTRGPEVPGPPTGAETGAGGRILAQLAQVDGRSLFFVPAAPPPPPAPPPKDDGPRTPPKPSRYGGPAIIAMINRTVWFADGKVLSVGDEAAGGVRVLAINAPWSATVEWSGVEFEVTLFEPDAIVNTPRPAPPATAGPPAPPSPQPAPSTLAPAPAGDATE